MLWVNSTEHLQIFLKQKPAARKKYHWSECANSAGSWTFIDFLSTFSEVTRLNILYVCGGGAVGSGSCDYPSVMNALLMRSEQLDSGRDDRHCLLTPRSDRHSDLYVHAALKGPLRSGVFPLDYTCRSSSSFAHTYTPCRCERTGAPVCTLLDSTSASAWLLCNSMVACFIHKWQGSRVGVTYD